MKILLDTHAFLWLVADSPDLSNRAKELFLDEKNDFYLSLASVWEMTIKLSIGKLSIDQAIEQFIPNQLQLNNIKQLEIRFRHITRLSDLPFHHPDPFDRLLICQAMEEKIPLLSADSSFDYYPVQRLW